MAFSFHVSMSASFLSLTRTQGHCGFKAHVTKTALTFPKAKAWLGLPWWRSGWESACQCRWQGIEPWSGKIPHAAEQLGPWATITEPALCNKRGRDSERPVHCDEEWPPLAATRESPHTETKTQHSHKKKKNILKIIFYIICIKMSIIQAGFIIIYPLLLHSFFLLVLKEVKIKMFLLVLKIPRALSTEPTVFG